MARYVTRVELHDAHSGDYEKLHLFMAIRAFYRIITSDDGRVYDLPSATYFSYGAEPASCVRALATEAAAALGK
jgi:hypothetical protein